jgi:hypothetical protein
MCFQAEWGRAELQCDEYFSHDCGDGGFRWMAWPKRTNTSVGAIGPGPDATGAGKLTDPFGLQQRHRAYLSLASQRTETEKDSAAALFALQRLKQHTLFSASPGYKGISLKRRPKQRRLVTDASKNLAVLVI